VNTNNNRVAIDRYELYVGDYSIDTITQCMIPLTYLSPQVENASGNIITDTIKWTAISGTFVATGIEKYLVLGNFKSNATTNTVLINAPLQTMSNDIYIDDVSLIELDLPAFAGDDAFVPPGDSVYIGRQNDVGIDEACTWYQMPGLNVAKINSAGMWVKPAGTTTYVVRQEICGNVKWDTVVVTESPVGLEDLKLKGKGLKVWPVPAKDEVQLQLEGYNGNAQLAIFNSLGILVRKEEVIFKEEKVQVRVSDLEAGCYYLETELVKQGSVRNRFLIER
jgi:hypothetical protein